MKATQVVTVLIIINLKTAITTTTDEIIIKTQHGYISGLKLKDYNNNFYYAFQQIPYAKPPLGNLRFRPPEQPQPWSGVRDGTQESPQCPQPAGPVFVGQEDCLYLNVYTNAVNTSRLQSVVVYFHAGGFFRSSGIFTNANPLYLITENVVIVTINYRLGALGFLTLDNSLENRKLLTPNNGFRDQVMVLKWVNKNIIHFGGNPNSVTISGVSAGGLSAHYHLYSSLSKGLFHKVISRSNTALAPLEPMKANTAIELGETIGIKTNNTTQLIEELRTSSLETLFKAQIQMNWFDFYLNKPMYVGLFLESPSNDSFITYDLLSLTKTGYFNRVPMLLSNTNLEGMVFNSSAVPNLWQMEDLSVHIPSVFGTNRSLVQNEVIGYYFNNGSSNPYYEFWGDIWFKHAGHRTLELASKYQKIYMADFAIDTKLNVFKLTHSSIAADAGACHTDDDTYIFNKLLSPQIVPDSLEEVWMKRMVRLQANFIKFSNPTPAPFADELLRNVEWRSYHKSSKCVLRLNNTDIFMAREDNKNFDFWDEMYEKYAPGK